MRWTKQEMMDLEQFGGHWNKIEGVEYMKLPWKLVAREVNRYNHNNRTSEACRKKWNTLDAELMATDKWLEDVKDG